MTENKVDTKQIKSLSGSYLRRVIQSLIARYDMIIYSLSIRVFNRAALKHEWFRQIIEVPIEIVNVELYEMGIEEQEKTYEKLRFPARKFSGYWVDHDDMTIKFYVDANSFVTPCTSETIALFEKVMNNL